MKQYIEVEGDFDGQRFGYPAASSMFVEGNIYYREVDRSFDHAFGTEKRVDYVVDDMKLYVHLDGNGGEVVASFDLENCDNRELVEYIEDAVRGVL